MLLNRITGTYGDVGTKHFLQEANSSSYESFSFPMDSITSKYFYNDGNETNSNTGKSLSEALLFAEHGENILRILF